MTEPSDEALSLAAAVLTGMEVEFLPPNGYNPLDVVEAFGSPAGPWRTGTDYSNNEIRSDGPQPLGQQADNLASLVDYLASLPGYLVDYNRAHHVHVNTRADLGPHVDRDLLVAEYKERRDSALELVADWGRRSQTSWCQPISVHGVCSTKSTELNNSSYLGTLEFRLWDATDDLDLYRRRCEWLHQWVAGAIQRRLDADAAREEMRAAANARMSAYQECELL